MTGRAFLDGRVVVHHGDLLDVLPTLPAESVDVVVTDPPYGLSDAPDAADVLAAWLESGVYRPRARGGFMGRAWDSFVPDPAHWRAVARVLKPGGHAFAFFGTRTVDLGAVALRLAGFEVRDLVAWLYGQGFPKSLDVAKAIDARKDWRALERLQHEIRAARKRLGISQSEAARRAGIIGPTERLGGGGYMWFETGRRVPRRDQWPAVREALGLSRDLDAAFEAAEREVVGAYAGPNAMNQFRARYADTAAAGPGERTRSTRAEARAWEGWGTALKPALEPVVVARKPLGEASVAANVLAHGTGALNVDGCRVEGGARPRRETDPKASANGAVYAGRQQAGGRFDGGSRAAGETTQGRWPANVVHDGGDEVAALFPADGGASAARFFYTAKATADDRVGSRHPTVKPVELIRWLVRLACPPGGLVLDPFAGTGTTGAAAYREGARAILVEREGEHVEDIARRLALEEAGPATRRAAIAKARADEEGGPGGLFAWAGEEGGS